MSDIEKHSAHASLAAPEPHTGSGLSRFAYRTPLVQIILVGFVCFLCPGMFNALSGTGGGGQLDATAADNGNVALYTTFAVVGFCAGAICNYLGIRYTLMISGFGYALYAGSLLCYNHTQSDAFVIAAGAILGVCAACLWTAQGAIMMSYPIESHKGRYISIFWAIFNTGAVIGAIIPVAENWNNDTGTVGDGTYIAFMILMIVGAGLAATLAKPETVIRPDGSHVAIPRQTTPMQEIKGLLMCLKTDTYIVALFPLFFASNWFYTYQFNDYNGYFFNIRTRSLNSLMYWLMQIVGAGFFGYFLDMHQFSRRTRAISGWILVFVLVNVIWGGGLAMLFQTHRGEPTKFHPDGGPHGKGMDVSDGGYAGRLWLYMFYGFLDAIWQTYAYWLMGALSNDPRKLAYFAGFYKGIQSAGAAIIWRIDALKKPFDAIFGSSWGLCGVALVCALPVILMKVGNHSVDGVGEKGVGGLGPQGVLGGVIDEQKVGEPRVTAERVSST
ncbi:MFS general substrate transporter [Saitoella complicata NRRL Y-17804]|uniref:Major facilitator superfamily (MFS) profile domain-containing protein n=1 Tax=Saitoella complicata (strain BCRC 22490 / CBS 7301 / JCM 7358 / NBRC 10748 / NRRL Y-17804) TaxID=698492 RepID=A0A0E9NHE7_SAICN|nr:MFS general substrate transporter [Saitoella complicata NRRL Y-17804]ODQ54025.1 MFS general substrate transporter [Saitoella complicata NRRL Y-17804]GAO49101.1 hypothetical protein G7K_3259-t1 [Saitoella complicata NRRL Y-17804]